MEERRTQPCFAELKDVLHRLPAQVILDRSPHPVLGVKPDGVVAYANPAATILLGYVEGGGLVGMALSVLLDGRIDSRPEECLASLRSAKRGEVVIWKHADGYCVRTAVSTPLLLRTSDTHLLIELDDMTELNWN